MHGHTTRRGERPGAIGIPDRDREPVRDDVRFLARECAAEDDDRRVDARAPELDALGDAGHAESPRAGVEERARSRNRAVAVCVRLHHGEHRDARSDELTHPAAVVAERPEADLGDGGSSGRLGQAPCIPNGGPTVDGRRAYDARS